MDNKYHCLLFFVGLGGGLAYLFYDTSQTKNK